MKFVICIPTDVKKQFDKATDDDLYGCYYDRHSIIGNAIKTARPFLESGDYISRQAVEEIINDIRDCISVGGYCAILERLKKLPYVNPQEPKTGHWKKIQSGDKDFPESIVCSRCGHENSYLDFGISSVPIGKSFKKSKFCPNCGARMAESEE